MGLIRTIGGSRFAGEHLHRDPGRFDPDYLHRAEPVAAPTAAGS